MKNTRSLIIIALIFFGSVITSCKKEILEYGMLPEPNGLVSATVNGEPWSTAFNSGGFYDDEFKVFGFGGYTYVNGFESQYFGITKISLDQPMQKVYSIKVSYDAAVPWGSFQNMEQDVILNSYQIADSASNNFVTVDSYDPATKKVKGRFNLTLLRESNTVPTPGFKDTLKISEGTYEVTLSVAK